MSRGVPINAVGALTERPLSRSHLPISAVGALTERPHPTRHQEA